MKNIVILGTGMAAWGAFDRFDRLGISPRVYDSRTHAGGHTASYRNENGFVFDDGPHISFTQNQEMIDVFADSVDGEYVAFSAYVDNYYEGAWVEHPAIVNLHELPAKLKGRIVDDFKLVHGKWPEKIDNYLEWLVATYGETYAEKFPALYGFKYHTCKAEQMNTDWIGPRLYQPDLGEVVRGAESKQSADVHYIKEFRYPKYGGFQSYIDRFIERSQPNLGFEAISINSSDKLVTFANGQVTTYEELVTSVPLPVLIPMIDNVPGNVLLASKALSCSQCVLVNIGVDRTDLSPAHWRYIYDIDLAAVRLSFPHMFSPDVAPVGCGAIQVEVYFSDKYKPFDGNMNNVLEEVIQNLHKMEVLRESDTILFKEARYVPWANVIFDLDTQAAVETVHSYLDEIQITYCGRYGDWAYIWTDESYLSGQKAAQKVVDRNIQV